MEVWEAIAPLTNRFINVGVLNLFNWRQAVIWWCSIFVKLWEKNTFQWAGLQLSLENFGEVLSLRVQKNVPEWKEILSKSIQQNFYHNTKQNLIKSMFLLGTPRETKQNAQFKKEGITRENLQIICMPKEFFPHCLTCWTKIFEFLGMN